MGKPAVWQGDRGMGKKVQSRERERVQIIYLLIPARTDTRYFHDEIYNKDGVEIRFIRGRLKF